MGTVPEQQRSSYLMAIWAVVAALIVSYLVVFGLSAAARLPLPLELMYGESIVLDLSRRVARGEELYPAPDLPLVVTAYMPVYYLLVGGLERAFGDSYVPGRVVSLASALGSAPGARRQCPPCGRALVGSFAGRWILPDAEHDGPAVGAAPSRRYAALCLTISGLAFVTAGRVRLAGDPAGPGRCDQAVVSRRTRGGLAALWPDRRSLLWFGGLFLGGLGSVVVGACVLTGGWFLWHTVVANVNPFDEDNLRAMLGGFLHFNGVPILAATALFSLPSRPGSGSGGATSSARSCPWWASARSAPRRTTGWRLTAATAVLIGLLAARLAASARPGRGAHRIRPGAARRRFAAVPIPGYQAVVREALRSSAAATLARVRGQLALAPMVAAEPGEILTDEPALAVAAGKPVAYEFVVFDLLVGQGLWDDRPILDAVAARRFGLVILSTPLEAPPEQARWSPALVAALRASYASAGPEGNYWLYRPVGRRQAAPDAPGGSLASGHGSEH